MKAIPTSAWCSAAMLGALLLGCAAVPHVTEQDRPEWVAARAPHRAGYVSAVGHAAPQGEDPDQRADLEARQALAAAISDRVTSDVTAFLREQPWAPAPDSPLPAQFRGNLASEVSASLLRQTNPAETWRETDGGLYVLYRLDVETLNERVVAKARQMLAHQNPFGAERGTVAEDLARYLAERTREQRLEAAREEPSGPEVAETGRPPEWLETGRHPDFPPDRFLTAIGLGEDPEAALDDARDELSRQSTRRLLEFWVRLRTGGDDPLDRDLRALGEFRPRVRPDELVATRIVATWHHPVTGTHFALAALDRRAAAIILRRRIKESMEASANLAASAANNARAENWRAALGEYLDALAAAQRGVLLLTQALVLARETDEADLRQIAAEPVVVPLKDSLAALLEQLEMAEVGGDRQWLPRTAVPRRPFVAKVTAGPEAAPVSNVPVRFSSLAAGGRLLARATTDAEGVATWQPEERLPGTSGGGAVAAALALQQMAPELDLSELDVPTARFEYVFRSREDTVYVLSVQGDAAAAEVRRAVDDALQREGFRPVEKERLLEHAVARERAEKPTDSELLESFADLRTSLGPGTFLLIMRGNAETDLVEESETQEGTLFIVYCPYEIRVLDADLPAETARLALAEGTGQGAYLEDRSEAARRARADAAANAAEQVLNALRARFGRSGAGE